MASNKRSIEHDPDYEDYEDVPDRQTKRQKVIEQDGKDATIKKIDSIVREEFNKEISYKEQEIDVIDERLNQARNMLDRLRACIVAKYYSTAGQFSQSKSSTNLHPTIKQMSGKRPRTEYVHPGMAAIHKKNDESLSGSEDAKITQNVKQETQAVNIKDAETEVTHDDSKRGSRFKVKKRIVVGNLSKYIPHDKRDENDQATHKWMVYVRGSKEEPYIDHYVKKVWFFLHPSYRPNDLVVISQPPFHLRRRGWGEFPVRIQLHFKDSRNKRVDIIHNLKLDRTYTGLQTLGAETAVDIELEKDSLPKTKIKPSMSCDIPVKLESVQSINEESSNLTDTRVVSSNSDFKIKTEPLEIPDSNVSCDSKTDIECENSQRSIIKMEPPDDVKMESQYDNSSAVSKITPPSVASTLSAPQRNLKGKTNGVDQNINISQASFVSPTAVTSERQTIVKTEVQDQHTPDKVKLPVLQPNTTYVRCVDNNGKIYLVPQYLVPKLINAGNIQKSSVTAITKNVLDSVHSNTSKDVVAKTTQITTTPAHATVRSAGISLDGGGTAIMKKSALNSSSRSLLKTTTVGTIPNTHNRGLPQNTSLPQSVKTDSVKKLGMGNYSTSLVVKSESPNSQYIIMRKNTQLSQVGDSNSAAQFMYVKTGGKGPTNPVNRQINSITNACGTYTPKLTYSLQNGVLRPAATLGTNKPVTVANLLNRGDKFRQAIGETSLKAAKKSKLSASDIAEEKHLIGCLVDFNDMESLVKAVVMRHPIIRKDVDRSLYPYCASSEEDFFKWRCGKKRASEWLRSRAVGKYINNILQEGDNSKQLQSWTTKRILIWCRRHGYTPLDKGLLHSMRLKASSRSQVIAESYSSWKPVVEGLEDMCSSTGTSQDDDLEIVDVEGLCETRAPVVKTELSPVKTPTKEVYHFPSSDESLFVRDTAQQIGVSLKAHQVEPGIYCHLVEEMIWAVTKRLADDMLRKAISTQCERDGFPNQVENETVFSAILATDKLDCLSNAHLGKEIEDKPG